jgi:hypothetical protein
MLTLFKTATLLQNRCTGFQVYFSHSRKGGQQGDSEYAFVVVACLCMRADVIYIFNNLKTVINDGTHCSHDLNGYSTAARHD